MQPITSTHPLEPLTSDELRQAVAIVRASRHHQPAMRVISASLHEPARELVLAWQGEAVERAVFFVLLDSQTSQTYEVVVSLTQATVTQFKHIPGVKPAIVGEDFPNCEAAVRNSPEFQAALARRGITDMSLVTTDPWSAGNDGDPLESDRRIARVLAWVHRDPLDNHYAYPIDGLMALVDLDTKEVIRVEDHANIPIPPQPGDYARRYIPKLRDDLKPLEIHQPDGVSFAVDGHEIRWQKWRMRVGFTHREGLVLYQVGYEDEGYEDEGRVRPIFYRASLAEMTVPYGDPSVTQARKCAFDVGEYGMGTFINSLELGCDCLGVIHYFDVNLCDSKGEVRTIQNAICLHEEDYSILWKHYDWRLNETEVRRSRRLVVSSIATVGNYEYGFYWYFYQDGNIQFEIKLTGIVTTAAWPPGQETPYGALLAPQLYAPHHQHFFCIRMEMTVDGTQNTVQEVNTVSAPLGEANPYGNAFYPVYTPLVNEQDARIIDPLKGRYWLITNPHTRNKLGKPTAYKLMPGDNVLPFAHPESSIAKRGGYMYKHLWVTPYHPDEKYPAGDYPNQHAGGDGLPKWIKSERNVQDAELVVWYIMGSHHIVRPEDWPVMPVATIGFMLKPVGFFACSPALDVPPSMAQGCQHIK